VIKMIEVGRLCVKIAGRDAGRKCVVVEIINNNFVLVDGDVRRKKCNINHLEPLEETIDIKKGASHEAITKEFKTLKLDVWSTKPKEKKARPRRIRKAKVKPVAETPAEKKEAKKEKKPKKAAKKTEAAESKE